MQHAAKWAFALLIGFGVIVAGWRVPWLHWMLTVFFILNCFVLIIVVLLQSGKAADLAGAFGGAGSQTAFGPRGAATFLSRATTWCAVMFMVCALALFLQQGRAGARGTSVLQETSKGAPKQPPATPAAKSPAPATPAPATQAPASQPQPPKKQ